MSLDFLPPLIRGIGTTIILIAAVISFNQAHRSVEQERVQRLQRITSISVQPSAEPEEDTVVEKVFENRWFEWVGFLGTATIAGSFYVEALSKIAKDKTSTITQQNSKVEFDEAVK